MPRQEPFHDRLIDLAARLIDGRRLWETMKENARNANFQDDGGGLHHVLNGARDGS
ncbi:hypothetical protein [Sinomonas terrae]|uniref:Uncharacterized protein n=1 Tax=Sinomonas terrae TaxID=2908838 RepID=A0ABS9TYG9_9MICC|nr:hypothetical protein [Sinomonas terrae]MCH6469492.1 hypothetical protein [Sinomonas terrae]